MRASEVSVSRKQNEASPYLVDVANALDIAFWVIDIDGLVTAIAPNATKVQILLFVLLFVIPGMLMAISSRNLLFLSEARIREQMQKIGEEGIVSLSGLWLLVLGLWSAAIAVRTVYLTLALV